MRKALSGTFAALLVAGTAIGSTASAAPMHRYDQQDRYVAGYCSKHSSDRDCRDWQRNRHSWNEDRYHSWYRSHRRDFGADDAAAAIFGFAAGAITGAISGAANGASSTSHSAACNARYKTYDRRSDTFMGFDGQRHLCRL